MATEMWPRRHAGPGDRGGGEPLRIPGSPDLLDEGVAPPSPPLPSIRSSAIEVVRRIFSSYRTRATRRAPCSVQTGIETMPHRTASFDSRCCECTQSGVSGRPSEMTVRWSRRKKARPATEFTDTE